MEERAFDRLTAAIAGASSRRQIMKGAVALILGWLSRASVSRALAAPAAEGGLVLDYYQAVNARAYHTAYALLGGSLANKHFADFVAGYADTAFVDLHIDAYNPDPARNQEKYDVTLTGWHTDGSIERFVGAYIVGREGGVPKIIAGSLAAADASDAAPLCNAGDLGVSATGDAAAGQRYLTITVTNNGGACVLGGVPKVTLRDGNGHKLISSKKESGVPITTVELAPGGQATLNLHWSNWCGKPVAGQTAASFSLPGGGSFSGLTGIGVPPCLAAPGGASALRARPWATA